MNFVSRLKIAIFALFFVSVPAHAHVSEQGIVLLLPTDIYIISGCLAVISSMLIVALLPHNRVFSLFKTIRLPMPVFEKVLQSRILRDITSICSFCIVIALIVIGSVGSRDPLVNMLPLTIWTFWWIAIFMLHSMIGNLWAWINPWTGIYNRLFGDAKGWFVLPSRLGQWPAIVLFVAFYIFIIADLAPDDPARLSNVVLGYLVFTMSGMIFCGAEPWLKQVECFTVLFNLVAQLSPIRINSKGEGWSVGLPGWKAMQGKALSFSQSLFLISMLASGSFDGVNETFWWLVQIDINPLAFPGRSAVVGESTFGMLAANVILYCVFALCVRAGLKLAASGETARPEITVPDFIVLFSALAISVLPITAVYHASHYLTSLMINGQYLIAAISDPLANGSNYLGLDNYQVTTGYLNDISSVRKIWLTQAGIVIFGHIIAVLMAHYAIAKHFPDRKQAVMFHAPIALFMASYTWFGLWLLAAPKGA